MTESTQPIRLAIVGCGIVTRNCHLPSLARIPQIQVAFLCDQNLDNAKGLKTQFGLSAAITRNVADLAGKIDAAIVAVPPRYHRPVTLQLLDMDVDVFCEKPLALTVEEAKEMVEAAERKQRHLAVGLCRRFEPNNAILQKLVEEGVLGEIREIAAEAGSPLSWPMPTASYYSRETTRGGVFFDSGIHVVDLILWMFGDLKDIDFEDDSFGGVESNAVLRGNLKVRGREVPCRMAFSWTHLLNNGIRVVGTEAWARTSFSDTDAVTVYRKLGGEPVEMRVYRLQSGAPVTGSDSYLDQLIDFAEAIRSRRPPFVAAATTLSSLSLIEKAYSIRKPMSQPWLTQSRAGVAIPE